MNTSQGENILNVVLDGPGPGLEDLEDLKLEVRLKKERQEERTEDEK